MNGTNGVRTTTHGRDRMTRRSIFLASLAGLVTTFLAKLGFRTKSKVQLLRCSYPEGKPVWHTEEDFQRRYIDPEYLNQISESFRRTDLGMLVIEAELKS